MRRQSRREELLDAALAEWIEHGYAAIGVREITARAGVSHGTFYNYFENRRQVLDVLVVREFDRYREILRPAVPGSGSAVTEESLRRQIEALNAELIRTAMGRVDVSAFLLLNVAGIDKEALRDYLGHFRELGRLATDILAGAAAAGLIRESIDLEFAGQAWMSSVLAVVTRAVADDSDPGDVDEIARILARLFLDGVPVTMDA